MNFGSDISTVPDLDELLEPLSGRRVLLESIYRRLSTPKGGLWWAPSYGSDLGALLDGQVDSRALDRAATALQQQLTTDERIRSANVQATYTVATRELRIVVAVRDNDGPFSVVFTLDSAGVVRILQ